MGTNGYLTRTEIKQLFAGHEVSVHSANHPNLTTLSKIDVVYEVVEDRKALERLMGYPFGNNNVFVIDAITGLGIEYARTVDDTYNFKIPENFLKWDPTVHQFAKAYHNLKFSVEKSRVINQSSWTIFFKKNGKSYSVLPGETLVLSN